MKFLTKLSISLALIIVFLIACFSFLSVGYAILFLHTYEVFTFSKPVAEITISGRKTDENGEYADVIIKTLEDTSSALSTLLVGDNDTSTQTEQEYSFKVYGDTVYFSGPMVKFKDGLILLNFKTIYKTGRVYGRYEIDNDKEVNREVISSFVIDDGYEEWYGIQKNLAEESVLGTILRLFIDTTQLSSAGQFITDTDQNYKVFITNNGFIWRLN
jgi:hypothetical protein